MHITRSMGSCCGCTSGSNLGNKKMQISDTFVKGFSSGNDINFRVDDPDFIRQNLQTGETIPNIFVVYVIEGLGTGLIVLFIVIYAIKKRKQK